MIHRGNSGVCVCDMWGGGILAVRDFWFLRLITGEYCGVCDRHVGVKSVCYFSFRRVATDGEELLLENKK